MGDEKLGNAESTAAARLGRSAGRIVRRAKKRVRKAEPEARRLAQVAADAVKPSVQKASEFVRDHEDELLAAGRVGASAAISRALPLALRPLAEKMVEELRGSSDETEADGHDVQ